MRMSLNRIMNSLWIRLCKPFRLLRSLAICVLNGILREGTVVFAGPVFIKRGKSGSIRFGKNVRFYSTVSMNPLSRAPMVIDTRPGGSITIGEGTGISSTVLSSRSLIAIGSRVLIGANTMVLDHDFHALRPEDRKDPLRRNNIRTKPIVIEDDVFIGTGCILLKGTRIGARSLVAAGSVVFGLDVPADSLVKGNPAVICGRTNA